MHIVLYQPEQPGNTGNIGRTCAATQTALHLIEPLGFRLSGKELRRAGMDYWEKVELHRYINLADFLEHGFGKAKPGARLWLATTKAKRSYTEVSYAKDDYLLFGPESAGLPEELLVERKEGCVRIPMIPDMRSLNLSNSVAVVLYEALRQQGFPAMEQTGALHRLEWKT